MKFSFKKKKKHCLDFEYYQEYETPSEEQTLYSVIDLRDYLVNHYTTVILR